MSCLFIYFHIMGDSFESRMSSGSKIKVIRLD